MRISVHSCMCDCKCLCTQTCFPVSVCVSAYVRVYLEVCLYAWPSVCISVCLTRHLERARWWHAGRSGALCLVGVLLLPTNVGATPTAAVGPRTLCPIPHGLSTVAVRVHSHPWGQNAHMYPSVSVRGM